MPSVDHDAAAAARTIDFNARDVGYVPQTLGHYNLALVPATFPVKKPAPL